MLQNAIHNFLDEAYSLYHSETSSSEYNSSLRKGILNSAQVAITNVRNMTGYADIKIQAVEDHVANYYGSYDFGSEIHFMKLNFAPVVVKLHEMVASGSTAAEMEQYVYVWATGVVLHELGHHHEYVTSPSLVEDMGNYQQGGLAINHVYKLDKAGLLTNSEALLNDNEFLEILTDSKQFIVEGERFADNYALETLKKFQMFDVIELLKADGHLVKDGYYYRLYSDYFLKEFFTQIFKIYFPNEQDNFKSIFSRFVYQTDEIVLSRLRAARRKQFQR